MANVKSLYSYNKAHGMWQNAYFIIDGDNQGNPFPGDAHFIHLNVYCIENLLLDITTLASISALAEAKIQSIICDLIKENKNQIFKKNQFLEFLVDHITPDSITYDRLSYFDASTITDDLIKQLGLSADEFKTKYFCELDKSGRLSKILPAALLKAVSSQKLVT